MKTVYLLRHAKSDRYHPAVEDHERPLAPRGIEATILMGHHLATLQPAPDLILCSTARRAVDTWKHARKNLKSSISALYEKNLYLAGSNALLERLQRLPAETNAVLLVGHNPDLQELALLLSKPEDDRHRNAVANKFPTAALAVLTFEAKDWKGVRPGYGTLQDFVTPGELA